MRYTLRALLAVGLLLGFYVISVAAVVALGAFVVWLAALGAAGIIVGKFGIIVLLIALAIGRGLFSRRRKPHHEEPSGLLLPESEQPALWAEVRALASRAQTRAPDEIRLVPEVNASVTEDSRLLGLMSGTRRLFLGVPLLMGVTADQLRSILAHELGHYSGRHTALAGVTYRGKENIGRVLHELGPDSWVGKFLRLYGRLFLAASNTVNRRQELEADQLSAQLVGPATARSALLELPPLDAAWGFFLDQYVAVGEGLGSRPADLFDGFARFLDDPGRQQQMDAIRQDPQEPPRSVYDSHPSITERAAVFAALPDQGQPDRTGPALDLLRAPSVPLERLQEHLYAHSGLTPVPFARLVPEAGAASAALNARRFLGAVADKQVATATLGGVLDLLRGGGADALLALVEGGDEPDRPRELVAGLLSETIVHALIEQGAAAYQLNWGGAWTVVDRSGAPIDVWALATAALDSQQGAEDLSSWLDSHGVPRDVPARIAESVDPGPDRIVGAVAPVTGGGVRFLIVLRSGLILRKPDAADRWTAGSRSFGGNVGRALIARIADRPVPELIGDPRSTYLPWPDVVRVSVRKRALGSDRIVIEATEGRSWTVKLPRESRTAGDPWAAMAHFLGERFGQA